MEDKIWITGDNNFSTDIVDKELQKSLKKFITLYPGSEQEFEGKVKGKIKECKVLKTSVKLDLNKVIGIGGEGTVLKMTPKSALKYVPHTSLNFDVSAKADKMEILDLKISESSEYLAAKEGLGPYALFGSSLIHDIPTTLIGLLNKYS